ncbi:MAG: Eco57I restriction-modification methylase domain-containing protein, partial [Anaerolinea sp.]|nr:Eco57I restriction-modification methylase domain-containing protein [Anaerolinea sp.]
IQDTLYGVDLKPEAIEIAQLRLWLALVVDQTLDQARPLPNLDYKLMAGDSLIETINGEPILNESAAALLEGAPEGDVHAPVQRNFLGTAVQEKFALFDSEKNVQQERAKLDDLRRRFFRAAPEERRELREQITAQERRIVYAGLHDKTERLMAQVKHWGEKSALNNGILSKGDRAKLEKVSADFAQLEALERDLQNPRKPLPFFLYRMHFHEVFAHKGGFDVVIANPPYVRQEQIKHLKEALEPAYPEVYAGTADLYVFFYARGLNLARPNGTLIYITPNKFMRAGYGKRLRDFLRQQVTLESLIDFGDLPLFDATTYPLIATLRKTRPAPDHTVRTLTVTDLEDTEHMALTAQSAFPMPQHALSSAEWQLSDPAARALMDKLRAAGKPLGEYVDGKFYYGIKTGLNEAFVINEAKRAELIAADPRSAEIIKPFLRGRDVKRWRVEPKGLYLIFTRRGINIDGYPAVRAHLEQYKDRLMPGVKGGRKAGTYQWYEIQDSIAYYPEFEKPKIVYQVFQVKPSFTIDIQGHYLNNALWMLSVEDYFLLGCLNSTVGWFQIARNCTKIQNGYQLIWDYLQKIIVSIPPDALCTKIAALAEKCLAAAKGHPERLPALEAQLNALVYQAYGLNAEEIALIEAQLAGRAGVESEENEMEEVD